MSTARMASKSALRSYLEVERKFLPTPYLRSCLHGKEEHSERVQVSKSRAAADGRPTSSLSFFRMPDKLVHDIYFDIDDVLAKKGIWIRRRASRGTSSDDPSPVRDSKEVAGLEAKVRLAGDYTDSQFLELQDESSIRAMLQKEVPDIVLENLKISADIMTHRKTWIIHGAAEAKPERGQIRIDLDEVTSPVAPEARGAAFKHHIGELEMTKEVLGGVDVAEHEEERSQAAEDMRSSLDDFMAKYSTLFPYTPKPKGKLEAYYEWREKTRIAEG